MVAGSRRGPIGPGHMPKGGARAAAAHNARALPSAPAAEPLAEHADVRPVRGSVPVHAPHVPPGLSLLALGGAVLAGSFGGAMVALGQAWVR